MSQNPNKKIPNQINSVTSIQQYSGPVPSPENLKKYNDIQPDFAG